MNKKRVLYKDYQRLFKKGNKLYSKFFLAYYLELVEDKLSEHTLKQREYQQTEAVKSLVKTSAKKKIGSAVVRNQEKRVMRSILADFVWKKPIFILVLCHRKPNLTFEDRKQALRQCLKPLLL